MPEPGHIAPAVFSLAAIFIWGASDFIGGFGSRRTNAFVFTALVHASGLGLMLVLALLLHSAFPSRQGALWALAAGGIGGFALAIFYRALASGKMGLTAPVAALTGAVIPTLVDVRVEGLPGRWPLIGFALAAGGIWLITRPEEGVGRPEGVGMAALAGVGFAGFYLCVRQAGAGSPLWIAACSRVASLLITGTIVVVSRTPLVIDQSRAVLAMLGGFLDISGTALFILASQGGRLDEAVVMSSLYPAVTVLLARVFLKEQFTRWKFVGLMAALAAVPMIAAG